MRWTRTVLLTRAPEADGEVVWSRRPDAGVKLAMMLCTGCLASRRRWWQESPVAREIAYKP